MVDGLIENGTAEWCVLSCDIGAVVVEHGELSVFSLVAICFNVIAMIIASHSLSTVDRRSSA